MMPDTFQCPQCGAAYTRERRRVGKAVVCTCGHKFLVPPPDFAAPPQPERPPIHQPRPAAPQSRPSSRTRSTQPPSRQATSDDSSGEVLPLAEPVRRATPQPEARWADPIEQQEAPLMEAEVVDPAIPYAEPLAPTDDLFGPGGGYTDPLPATGLYAPPLVPPPAPKPTKQRKKKRRPTGDGRATNYSNWVAYFVLFLILPAAAIFTVIGVIQYRRPGAVRGAAQPQTDSRPRTPMPGSQPAGSTAVANEPAPSGYAITIWNAVKRGPTGEFSVEYRLDRGPLDPSKQYFWVVIDPRGKIEFPVPIAVWKLRDKLSGTPIKAAPGEFTGPYMTYIEEQVGGTRSRASNEVTVASN